jgi:hypothetical protein
VVLRDRASLPECLNHQRHRAAGDALRPDVAEMRSMDIEA